MLPSPPPLAVPRFPSKASHIVERLLDGELVLYDPYRQRVHALNPTAAFIWRACDGSHNDHSLVEALCERYPASRGAIESDVPSILRLFADEELLQG